MFQSSSLLNISRDVPGYSGLVLKFSDSCFQSVCIFDDNNMRKCLHRKKIFLILWRKREKGMISVQMASLAVTRKLIMNPTLPQILVHVVLRYAIHSVTRIVCTDILGFWLTLSDIECSIVNVKISYGPDDEGLSQDTKHSLGGRDRWWSLINYFN